MTAGRGERLDCRMIIHILAALLAGASPTPAPGPTGAPPSPPAPAEPPAAASPVPSPSVSLPACVAVKIAPIDAVNSKNAQPGAPFRFKVTSVDDGAKRAFPTVTAGTEGWGIVSVVRRGLTGGEPGLIVLETRFVIASDGSHVPATLARTVSGLFTGKSHNSPTGASWIPFVGYAASAYDAFHKGGDITVGPTDTLTVVLGDNADMGTCSLPTAPP